MPFFNQLLKNPDNVASTFLENVDMFKIYAVYCSNQPRIHGILKDYCKKYPQLDKIIQDSYNDTKTRNQGLEDFLILPMQRICKYPLLLSSLLKETSPQKKEYEVLQKALTRFKTIVSQINERTRSMENIENLSSIEKRIKESKSLELVNLKRNLIWEGRLKIKGYFIDTQKKPTVFLFNDLLLFCFVQDPNNLNSLFTVKHLMSLENCVSLQTHIIDDGDKNFEVIFEFEELQKKTNKKMRFKAVSNSERDTWISKFKNLDEMIKKPKSNNRTERLIHIRTRSRSGTHEMSPQLSEKLLSNSTSDLDSNFRKLKTIDRRLGVIFESHVIKDLLEKQKSETFFISQPSVKNLSKLEDEIIPIENKPVKSSVPQENSFDILADALTCALLLLKKKENQKNDFNELVEPIEQGLEEIIEKNPSISKAIKLLQNRNKKSNLEFKNKSGPKKLTKSQSFYQI